MEGQWDREGNEINERLFRLIYPSLESSLKDAFREVFSKARYFVSFNDLTRYILLSLEQRCKIPQKVKEVLTKELEEIYTETQIEVWPFKQALGSPDMRAIRYASSLHDFYLGRFFQADRELRLRVEKWFSEYYLKEGNPIGKGQEGIKEFLNKFGEYIKPQTEWKTRQIIDTSVNYMRNSARLRALQKARITRYRFDAVGDRLTCPVCRSYDGRVFKTEEAIRVLDTIEGSDDPGAMADYKPFVKEPYKGSSKNAPTKMPPLHPNCRCRVVASIEEELLPVTVERPAFQRDTLTQRELETQYRALTRQEINNRIKAHLGSDWLRPAKGEKGINAYKSAKKDAERHFFKHGHEFGFKTPKEYYDSAYDVIKKPDEVYVERIKDKTFYIFRKSDKVVVSRDDDLAIKTYFKLNKQFESFLKERERDGLIKVL